MAIIHFFQAGFCTHPACVAVRGQGFGLCEFPARVFLLEANGRFWLWDTGYSEHFFEATQGIYQLYRRITPVNFDPSQHIRVQLKQFGLDTSDLQAVILSHFHADHVAGVKDFPNVPMIADRQAFEWLRPLTGIRALKQGFLPKLMPSTIESQLIDFHTFNAMALPSTLAPFSHGFAVPNSQEEIIIVPLEGHAVGHIGAFILTDSGWELIASDAAWSLKNYRDNAYPAPISQVIMANPKAFYHTLERLKTLDNQHIAIHLSHEL